MSPCIGVCRIDPDSGKCAGCNRSLREIADYGKNYIKDNKREKYVERS